jgi:hypothetical protein
MHTLKIIVVGFVLLGACLLAARWLGGTVSAVKWFFVLWLIGTLGNMWFGVSRAGYWVKDEAPVALVVYALPAIVAIAVWRKTSHS